MTLFLPETKDHPRAFLWIPENCRQLRAIVIADQNMEETALPGCGVS